MKYAKYILAAFLLVSPAVYAQDAKQELVEENDVKTEEVKVVKDDVLKNINTISTILDVVEIAE